MKALSKHLKSIAWMVFGLFFVFGLVIYMNNKGGISKPEVKKQSMELAVQRMVKPKPKPKPKPERAKPKRSTPSPSIDSSLSGIDTGLEAFMSDMNMDDTLLGDVGKNMIMSEDSVDVAPQPIERTAMDYPKKAYKSGISGYVVMNLLVSKTGNVEKVKVLQSEPADVFDDAAVNGVKTWRFKPAQYKGEAVKVWAKQKVRFDLQ